MGGRAPDAGVGAGNFLNIIELLAKVLLYLKLHQGNTGADR